MLFVVYVLRASLTLTEMVTGRVVIVIYQTRQNVGLLLREL